MKSFEERKRAADAELWKTLNEIFPNLACNARFEHVDAAAWWYTFELKNDARRQTIGIRHDRVKEC